MIFSSATFLFVFLPIVFLSNFVLNKKSNKLSNVLLLFSSLVFYAWGEPQYIVLMILSIAVNYMLGIIIEHYGGNLISKTITVLCVLLNLGLLFAFKYLGFFLQIIELVLPIEVIEKHTIALPIGISFFTFQEISYILDISNRRIKAERSVIKFALYISFFPQLIAGPIVKYRDISRQMTERKLCWEQTADGFKTFIIGLGKKVLIANCLGEYVDYIYGIDISNLGSLVAWIGAITYTFQIYYDFSGYSDMAVGIGKMFGFSLPQNFNYPYLSRSISEFWRRWHITLGTWFREYVYIPLGGNKKGKTRTLINLLIVFFLTGLWHGANYTFLMWGLLNGLVVVLERIIEKRIKIVNCIARVYSFILINVGWVVFRSKTVKYAIEYLGYMLWSWRNDYSVHICNIIDKKYIITLIIAIMGSGIMQTIKKTLLEKKCNFVNWKGWNVIGACYCIIVLVMSISTVASDTYNPFIYFQF